MAVETSLIGEGVSTDLIISFSNTPKTHNLKYKKTRSLGNQPGLNF